MVREVEKTQTRSLAELELSRRQFNAGLVGFVVEAVRRPISMAKALETLSVAQDQIGDSSFQYDPEKRVYLRDNALIVPSDSVESSANVDLTPEKKVGIGRLITHLKSSKYVVVAMDDCFDTSLTNAALDTAKKAKAKMTFCLIGNRLKISKEHTRTYKRIFEEQDIQNHTMKHGMMGFPHTSDPEKIEYAIGNFRNAARDAVDPDYQDFGMRPPGGTGVNTATGWVYGPIRKSCARHNLDILSWNLESGAVNRGFNSSAALARRDVIPHLRGGVVLLLHAIPPDVSILGEIFDTLKAKKLTSITFSEAVAMGIT